MPTSPLARDKFGRAISLPEKADGFTVLRVPSGKGGAPRPVEADGYQLEIPLDMTEERLLEMVEREGRYRLDVMDKDGNALGISCWVTFKSGGGKRPVPETASEAALLSMVDRMTELVDKWANSNATILRAAAIAMAGKRGAPIVDDDDPPSSLRDLIRQQLPELTEERQLSPEEEKKQFEAWLAKADGVLKLVGDHGPKAGILLNMLKEWLKSQAAEKVGAGAAANGVAS